KQQREAIKTITPDLLASFDAKTTQHNTDVAATVVWKLANNYADMNHVYLTSPIFQGKKTYQKNTLFEELTRTDDVANDDYEEENEVNLEYFDETFTTRHQENQNTERNKTFLLTEH